MSAIIQLRVLINLAMSDMHFAEEEREMIYMLAKAHGISQKEVDTLIADPQPADSLDSFTEEERFQMLYNIVQLMKIDRKVYITEIRYCQDLAIRLGYDKRVIQELSAKMYSNPAITSDRNILRRLVRQHKQN